MLHALTRFFRRGMDAAQLELEIAPAAPRNADELLARLRTLGLRRITRVRLTKNRTVMVSYAGTELRANEGYLLAPEPVLRAIVAFVEGRTRAKRRMAQRSIIAFPIASNTAARAERRERTHADDGAMVEQLEAWHHRYNARHFDGALRTVPIRVSRRMKSRLGHYSPSADTMPAEIAISRSHIRRHGWTERCRPCCTRWCTSGRMKATGRSTMGLPFARSAEPWASRRTLGACSPRAEPTGPLPSSCASRTCRTTRGSAGSGPRDNSAP